MQQMESNVSRQILNVCVSKQLFITQPLDLIEERIRKDLMSHMSLYDRYFQIIKCVVIIYWEGKNLKKHQMK